jgi:hypothetical protein
MYYQPFLFLDLTILGDISIIEEAKMRGISYEQSD